VSKSLAAKDSASNPPLSTKFKLKSLKLTYTMQKRRCSLMMISPFLFAFLELFRKHMAKLTLCFVGIEKSTISQPLESQLVI
jgi:hypothetical protein